MAWKDLFCAAQPLQLLLLLLCWHSLSCQQGSSCA
jgi:hypothetical protein